MTITNICYICIIMKVLFNNAIIAQSDKTIMIETNHYFPPNSVNSDYLKISDKTYTCPWKGVAIYYDIDVENEIAKNAAWIYKEPKQEAKEIAGYVAFDKAQVDII